MKSQIQMSVLVAVLMAASAVQSAELDNVEAAVCAAWEKIKSASYDMEMISDMSSEVFSMKSTSNGTTDMLMKNGTWMMRSDMKSSSTQKIQGNETKTDMTALTVADGKFVYSLTETNGQKQATKTSQNEWSKMAGGKGFFEFLKQNYDLKVLPDESVDGTSCYVLDVTPKVAAGQTPMKYYFAKDSGMVIQSLANGPDGKSKNVMKLKNLKINPSISEDKFVFNAPAGVEVQDLDKLQQQATAQENAAPQPAPAEEKETAAPAKKEEPAKAEEPEKKKEEKKPEKKKKPKIPGF